MGTPQGAREIFKKYSQGPGKQVHGLGDSAWTDNHLVLSRRGKYFSRVWPDPAFGTKEPELNDLLGLCRSQDSVLKMHETRSAF